MLFIFSTDVTWVGFLVSISRCIVFRLLEMGMSPSRFTCQKATLHATLADVETFWNVLTRFAMRAKHVENCGEIPKQSLSPFSPFSPFFFFQPGNRLLSGGESITRGKTKKCPQEISCTKAFQRPSYPILSSFRQPISFLSGLLSVFMSPRMSLNKKAWDTKDSFPGPWVYLYPSRTTTGEFGVKSWHFYTMGYGSVSSSIQAVDGQWGCVQVFMDQKWGYGVKLLPFMYLFHRWPNLGVFI